MDEISIKVGIADADSLNRALETVQKIWHAVPGAKNRLADLVMAMDAAGGKMENLPLAVSKEVEGYNAMYGKFFEGISKGWGGITSLGAEKVVAMQAQVNAFISTISTGIEGIKAELQEISASTKFTELTEAVGNLQKLSRYERKVGITAGPSNVTASVDTEAIRGIIVGEIGPAITALGAILPDKVNAMFKESVVMQWDRMMNLMDEQILPIPSNVRQDVQKTVGFTLNEMKKGLGDVGGKVDKAKQEILDKLNSMGSMAPPPSQPPSQPGRGSMEHFLGRSAAGVGSTRGMGRVQRAMYGRGAGGGNKGKSDARFEKFMALMARDNPPEKKDTQASAEEEKKTETDIKNPRTPRGARRRKRS